MTDRRVGLWLDELDAAVSRLVTAQGEPERTAALNAASRLLTQDEVPGGTIPHEAELLRLGQVISSLLAAAASADITWPEARGRVSQAMMRSLGRFAVVARRQWGLELALPSLDDTLIEIAHHRLVGDPDPIVDLQPVATIHRPILNILMALPDGPTQPIAGPRVAADIGKQLDAVAAALGQDVVDAMGVALGNVGERTLRRVMALAYLLPRLRTETVDQVGPRGGIRAICIGGPASVDGFGLDHWSGHCVLVHSHVMPAAFSGADLRRWRALVCPLFVLVDPSQVHVLALKDRARAPSTDEVEAIAHQLDSADLAVSDALNAPRNGVLSPMGRLALAAVRRQAALDRLFSSVAGVSLRHISNPTDPLLRTLRQPDASPTVT